MLDAHRTLPPHIATRPVGPPVSALKGRAAPPGTGLPWIRVAEGAPYFVTEFGEPWTPIGHNDALTWPRLNKLWRRRDPASVESHLRDLAESGVTVLRLMLEYAQDRHRYLERPVGRFNPHVVRFWDDLIQLCERVGMRLLLTPFDTYWTWLKWHAHPYNRKSGGPLDKPSRCCCREKRGRPSRPGLHLR